jgi:glucan phosphoethanolaminetransferase (alkaline phosphatase superfamily)
VALAKACLAAEPEDRPRDAEVVAREVAACLERLLRASEARWYLRIAKLMLLLAAAFFVGHLAAFGLVLAGGPEALLWLAVFAPYALLFATFRTNRAEQLAARQPQRLLWSIWVGHLFAAVAVFLGCRLTAGADYVHGFLLAYPGYAALTGLAFFVMGSTYWSREYAFGLAWVALAALMPLFPPYAPLATAVLSAVCDLWIGLYLRRLAAAESLREDHA